MNGICRAAFLAVRQNFSRTSPSPASLSPKPKKSKPGCCAINSLLAVARIIARRPAAGKCGESGGLLQEFGGQSPGKSENGDAGSGEAELATAYVGDWPE